MAENYVAPLLIFFVSALIIQSSLISYFGNAALADNSVTPYNFATTNFVYLGTQDFTTGNFNNSAWYDTLYGTWTDIQNVGMVLNADILGSYGDTSYLLIKNEESDSNGDIINTYVINNSVQQDYAIELRYTGNSGQNEIQVDNTGFHIPNYIYPIVFTSANPVYLGDKFDFAYSGANQVVNPTIETIYNENAPSVTFIFNGQTLFTTDQLSGGSLFSIPKEYYGGVASQTTGFTLESYQTPNQIDSGTQSYPNMVLSFLANLFHVLLYTVPSSYDPTGFINWFLRLEEIAIFILGIVFIGGMI